MADFTDIQKQLVSLQKRCGIPVERAEPVQKSVAVERPLPAPVTALDPEAAARIQKAKDEQWNATVRHARAQAEVEELRLLDVQERIAKNKALRTLAEQTLADGGFKNEVHIHEGDIEHELPPDPPEAD